ncbi:universal stress protein [Salinimicrobium catena]|uniref:universal stress protein n=1 Tax=Salinimicrobium catena TaxID=390640 RepID=UPI002FE46669
MRKIIIPTDFSENAFNALKFAAELFKYERSDFFLLHAYADEVYNTDGLLTQEFLDEFKETTRKNSETELEKTKERILELFPNPRHKFHTVASFGMLIDEVNDLVDRENADIIVTSTRGKTNDRKMTFGSNSLQIIKYVQCPVLSIPEKYEYSDPKKILFPSNYMLPYQKRELKLAGDLARAFCAELHMLYISNFPLDSFRQKDNQLAIKEQFYDVKQEFHQVEEQEKTAAILEAIEKLDIDLLILVNSRHSYLENVLYQSTLDKIGLHPKIPFLVLQNFHRT